MRTTKTLSPWDENKGLCNSTNAWVDVRTPCVRLCVFMNTISLKLWWECNQGQKTELNWPEGDMLSVECELERVFVYLVLLFEHFICVLVRLCVCVRKLYVQHNHCVIHLRTHTTCTTYQFLCLRSLFYIICIMHVVMQYNQIHLLRSLYCKNSAATV